MTLSAHQPHYLPYIGLLAKISLSDVFVLQDDLQYVKQEWQNRNRVRTASGWRWLTVPVVARSRSIISEVVPASNCWPQRHQRIVHELYRRAPLERLAAAWEVARAHAMAPLATVNEAILLELMRAFDIATPVVRESELRLTPAETATRDARLLALCKRFGCDRYLSGTGAKAYLTREEWRDATVQLAFTDWRGEPYRQQFPGWLPGLSCIDVLLNVDSPATYLRSSAAITAGW